MVHQVKLPNQTVYIDWSARALSYRSARGDIVRVHVLEWREFHICCAIAMTQRLSTDNEGITDWQGMTQDQFNQLTQALAMNIEYDGFKPIWSYMTSGRGAPARHVTTEISVNGTIPESENGVAQALFRRVPRGGFVLGKPDERLGNRQRLWAIEFPEPTHDGAYTLLRETVCRLVEDGTLGSRVATDRALKQAICAREIEVDLDVWGVGVPMTRLYEEPTLSLVHDRTVPRDGAAKPDFADIGAAPQGHTVTAHDSIIYSARKFCNAISSRSVSSSIRFVVLGGSGSGKTSLLQFLANEAALANVHDQAGKRLPVRMWLPDWERRGSTTGLVEWLAQSHQNLQPVPDERRWRRWLHNGDVLLLLDGLDEISPVASPIVALKQGLRDFPNCPVVITCRTQLFHRYQSLCSGWPVLQLSELTPAQRKRYIERALDVRDTERRRFIEALAQSPLMGNPLMLETLCFVGTPPDGMDLPTTRAALLDRAVHKLLGRARTATRYPGPEPGGQSKRMVLETAALQLLLQCHAPFNEAELGQALTVAITEHGYDNDRAPWSDAFRGDYLANSGLLWGDEPTGYSFSLLIIQEMLAASALARKINARSGSDTQVFVGGRRCAVWELVETKAWDPGWEEVIVLLAGQLRDPEPLFEMLGDPQRDDAFRHRHALLALCLAEMPLRWRTDHPIVVNQVTTAVVEMWWRHACNDTTGVLHHLSVALPALALANGTVNGTPLGDWLAARLRLGSNNELYAAVTTIEAMGSTAAVPAVADAVCELLADSKRARTAAYAAEVMRPLRPSPTAQQHIVAALSSDDEDRQRAGAQAATALDPAVAIPEIGHRLSKLLEHPHSELRAAAVSAIGHLRSSSAISEFTRRLPTLLRDDDVVLAATLATCDALEIEASDPATIERLGRLAGDPPIVPLGQLTPEEARERIARIAVKSELAVQITRLLRSPDEKCRFTAVKAIQALGARAAVPEITDCLRSLLDGRSEDERLAAVLALDALGSWGGEHTLAEQLLCLLRQGGEDVCISAMRALRHFTGATAGKELLSEMTRLLRTVDLSDSMMEAAIAATARIGQFTDIPAKTLDAIVSHLRGPVSNLVLSTTAQAARAIPALRARIIALLDDKVPTNCKNGLMIIAHGGHPAPDNALITRLTELLGSDNEEVRQAAAVAFSGLKDIPLLQELHMRLCALLRHARVEFRNAAAKAVSHLGTAVADPMILDAIVDCLRRDTVSAESVFAVGHLGQTAARADVLDALLSILEQGNKPAVILVYITLARFGGAAATETVINRLKRLLDSTEPDRAAYAARALAELGPAATRSDVLESLLNAVETKRGAWALPAEGAIVGFGVAAAKLCLLRSLPRLLGSQSQELRRAALRITLSIGSVAATRRVLQPLAACLRDDDLLTRYPAMRVIERLQQDFRLCHTDGGWRGIPLRKLTAIAG